MRIKIFFTFLLFTAALCYGQNDYEKEYIEIAPGPQFEASGMHELIFGKHWREIWTIPIKVEILDLDRFAGGLTPIKRGGGMQTKSLRLKGEDGKIWKFRSMDKDPSKVLPEPLRESIFADVMKDQISSANPMAPLVVAPILDAVGILQAKPYLCYMPDSPKLGEFREEFGNLLGMMEIHPTVDEDEGIEFEGAEKVKGTLDLFDRLAEKRSEKFDSKEFLKARLIDIFLGDWDRHTDQWKWAKYTVNGVEYWRPIPRDRDQAFAKFDGWAVSVAEYLVPQFNHFDEDYPQAEDISWSGRFLDRRILPVLTKEEWDSVTTFVYESLTDSVIVYAVKQLPEKYHELIADELTDNLIQRRNKLYEISSDYYVLINTVIDVYCSDKRDFVEVNRIDDKQTEVMVYRRDKKSGDRKGDVYFYKLADNCITDEIRIYLMDNDDRFIIRGEVDSGPLVRVIGGDGGDEYEDSSIVNGYWLGFTPIPDAENKTRIYDSGKKTMVTYGPGTVVDDEKIPEPKTDAEKYEPLQRDRSHDWMINPKIGLDTDNGLVIGGGPQFFKYNFRAEPYDYWWTLTAEYATKPKNGRIIFEGIFNTIFKRSSLHVNFLWSGLTLTKYFGYGNETFYDSELEENDYFKLEQRILTFNPELGFRVGAPSKILVGFSYVSSNVFEVNEDVLQTFIYPDYGLDKFDALGLNLSYELDSRDNEVNPGSGYYFKIRTGLFPELLDVEETFTRALFDVRGYWTADSFTEITFALRAGGGKSWGKYPYYAAQFIGGASSLRGYSRERFSGDAALFGQAEMRMFLGKMRFIIPGRVGINIFAETGRVFARTEDSDIWHPSYGGGLYLSYLGRMLNIGLNFAYSKEKLGIYITTSMMF